MKFRAVLLAFGLTYAFAAIHGGMLFTAGKKEVRASRYVSALLYLVRAEAVFPLSPHIREAEAVLRGITNALPPEMTLAAIDGALAHDPLSPNMLWHKTLQELRRGNLEGAQNAISLMEKSGPGWPQTENAKEIFKAVKERMGK